MNQKWSDITENPPWWTVPLHWMWLFIPFVLVALGVGVLFDAIWGKEFTIDDTKGSGDAPFLLVLVFLTYLAGYFIGASSGYDAGKERGIMEGQERKGFAEY